MVRSLFAETAAAALAAVVPHNSYCQALIKLQQLMYG
jgi:hypothetical protein